MAKIYSNLNIWVDDATDVDVAGLVPAIDDIEQAIGNLGNHGFAIAEGLVTQNGTTVEWPKVHIYHHRATDGAMVHNELAASTGVLTDGQAHVVTLSDTQDDTVGVSVIAVTGLTTLLNDKKKLILWVRADPSTGTGILHHVGMKSAQQLNGTDTLTGTSTPVSFPTGTVMPSTDSYRVFLMARSAGFWALDPRITTYGTGSFTITHGSSSSENFDWMIVPL